MGKVVGQPHPGEQFRWEGYREVEAVAMVASFAARCTPPLDRREAKRITESAYRANENAYQFGCGTGRCEPEHKRAVCHTSRTHLSLDRNAPIERTVGPPSKGQVVAVPQVGGLHHRYTWAA